MNGDDSAPKHAIGIGHDATAAQAGDRPEEDAPPGSFLDGPHAAIEENRGDDHREPERPPVPPESVCLVDE